MPSGGSEPTHLGRGLRQMRSSGCLKFVQYLTTLRQRSRSVQLAALLLSGGVPLASPADTPALTGQELAHDVYKGNCLGCHQIPGDPAAISLANIGPSLAHMRERFPDRSVLRAQIWDSTLRNPNTVMPPFGKHKVLTEAEIDRIVDYLYRY